MFALQGSDGATLSYFPESLQADQESQISARLLPGQAGSGWFSSLAAGRPATRVDRPGMMAVLADVEMILIRAQFYQSGAVDVTVSDIQLETGVSQDTGLGATVTVEQCLCPPGYAGLSCESCAPGYSRQPGSSLCSKVETSCPPGYYGDPSAGLECQVCPCPLTTPSNQFARECYLDVDRQVTCKCPPGYTGRRCGECDTGYLGNPTILGNSCTKGE